MFSCPARFLPRFARRAGGRGGGGDFNRDRLINDADEAIIQASLDAGSPGSFSNGDMTGDGSIDEVDYELFQTIFNTYLPAAPSVANSLTASTLSASATRLTWSEPDWAYDGFRIYRSLDGFDFEQVAELPWSGAGGQGTSGGQEEQVVYAWDDDNGAAGLEDGTKYWYRVRSFTNAAGNSHTTEKVWTVTVLPAVDDVEATYLEDGSVLLTWQPGSVNHTRFAVEYSDDSGQTWTAEGTTDAWQSYHVADAAFLPQGRQFRVRAEQESGGTVHHASAWSTGIAAELEAPTALAAVVNEPGVVELSWDFASTEQNAFFVQYSDDGGLSWQVEGTGLVGGYDDGFEFELLPDGQGYDFRVRAELLSDTGGVLAYSAWSQTSLSLLPILAPSGVNAWADGSTTPATIWVDWSDNSAGEAGYQIERRPTTPLGSPWSVVGNVAADVQSFTDASITDSATRYVYRVLPEDSGGPLIDLGDEDPNDVALDDAEGYRGGIDEDDDVFDNGFNEPLSITATATDLNDPHAYVIVGASATYLPSNEPIGARAYDAQKLIGLEVEQLIEASAGEGGSQVVYRVRGEVVATEDNGVIDGWPVVKAIWEWEEVVEPFERVGTGIGKWRIPTQADSVTVTASVSGSLLSPPVDTLTGDPLYAVLTGVSIYYVDEQVASVTLDDILLTPQQETEFGSLVKLNWDNDYDDDGSEVTDYWSAKKDFEVAAANYEGANGHQRENDLWPIKLETLGLDHKDANGNPLPNVKLDRGGDKIKVYQDPKKQNPIGKGEAFLNDGLIFLEGVELSTKLKDDTLTATGLDKSGAAVDGAKHALKVAVGPILDKIVFEPTPNNRPVPGQNVLAPELFSVTQTPTSDPPGILAQHLYIGHPNLPREMIAQMQTVTIENTFNGYSRVYYPKGVPVGIPQVTYFEDAGTGPVIDSSSSAFPLYPNFHGWSVDGNVNVHGYLEVANYFDNPTLFFPANAIAAYDRIEVGLTDYFRTYAAFYENGVYYTVGSAEWSVHWKGYMKNEYAAAPYAMDILKFYPTAGNETRLGGVTTKATGRISDVVAWRDPDGSPLFANEAARNDPVV